MRIALVVVVLLGSEILWSDGMVLDIEKQELSEYNEKIKATRKLLGIECPSFLQAEDTHNKGNITYSITAAQRVYEELKENLLQCWKQKSNLAKNSTTKLPSAKTWTLVPEECMNATNLTESWRMDHNASFIVPFGPHSSKGWACDFHKELQWFRFTGAAGTRMLDSCPPAYSCGTANPYWSDGEIPTAVGKPITITAYLSLADNPGDGNCKFKSHFTRRKVKVMRCSLSKKPDLIYKYTPDDVSIKYIGTNDGYYDICGQAFCGMI